LSPNADPVSRLQIRWTGEQLTNFAWIKIHTVTVRPGARERSFFS
jgi:hypothetical protein